MRGAWSFLLVWCFLAACHAPPPDPGVIRDLQFGGGGGTVELVVPTALPPDVRIALPPYGMPVSFVLSDSARKGQRYRYALFHHNDTYAFPAVEANGTPHPLAGENFYGAAGPDSSVFLLSDPLDDQGRVRLNASIMLRSDPRDEFPQHPEARDPRVGAYSLLVVALPEDEFLKHPLPAAIRDIRVREGDHFIDPYWYWLYGPGSRMAGVSTLLRKDVVRLRAAPDPAHGIHGDDTAAAFQHFRPHIDPASRFNNVPIAADVLGHEYGPRQHDSAWVFTPADKWIPTVPSACEAPCTSTRLNAHMKALEFRNRAGENGGFRKENAGISTRRSFTYGRFLVHAQLSPLLNDSDMWNGLTNAIWLIGSNLEYGQRRACTGGYRPYIEGLTSKPRETYSSYAEIDFEIMKGMPLCPERAFPPIYPQPVAAPNAWRRVMPAEVVAQRGNVAVACTNWDLACPDPPQFAIGCQDVLYNGQAFAAHRWDRDYRAVTEKSMEPDDALFGPNGYWFEITWRPDEIIWRVGPSPDELRVVGYMNSSMTSVPNTPMSLVVSQEFHNTRWWPGSPYEQGCVPFPSKDLVGRVFEVRVE
jgi:hypothetical protein